VHGAAWGRIGIGRRIGRRIGPHRAAHRAASGRIGLAGMAQKKNKKTNQ
jgi:hypothetical protein